LQVARSLKGQIKAQSGKIRLAYSKFLGLLFVLVFFLVLQDTEPLCNSDRGRASQPEPASSSSWEPPIHLFLPLTILKIFQVSKSSVSWSVWSPIHFNDALQLSKLAITPLIHHRKCLTKMPRLADRCLESLRPPPHDTEMIVLDDNYWDFIGILFPTIPQWLFQKWMFYMFYDVVLSPQRIGDLWPWFHQITTPRPSHPSTGRHCLSHLADPNLGEEHGGWDIPSGYLTVCHGKSPCVIGKPSINGPFSMAMLNNQRVFWIFWDRNDCNKHLIFWGIEIILNYWGLLGIPRIMIIHDHP